MNTDPKDAAKYLFENGLTIKAYESLQNQRKERLDLWLDRRIKVIAEKEMELIDYGDKVLNELKNLYNQCHDSRTN